MNEGALLTPILLFQLQSDLLGLVREREKEKLLSLTPKRTYAQVNIITGAHKITRLQ